MALALALTAAAASCARRPAARADAAPLQADATPAPAAPDAAVPLDAARADEAAAFADAEAGEAVAPLDATAAVASEPLLPAEDPAVLESDCRKGDLSACLRAASWYAAGLAGLEAGQAHARTLWQRACERKHPEGCRRLAQSLLAGEGSSSDVRRGTRLLDQACELGSLVACAGLAGRYFHGDGERVDIYQSLLRFQRACNGGYAGACVAMQAARRFAETFDLPLPRPRESAPPARPPAPETACPSSSFPTPAPAVERLDGGLLPIPPDRLRACLPGPPGPRVPPAGWSCAAAAEVDAAAVARATCARQGAAVTVAILDHYRDCTLQPGTGAAILAARLPAGVERTSLRLGGLDAVVLEAGARSELRLWLADRCELVVGAGNGATEEDLRALAAAADLQALRTICAWREGEGLPEDWGSHSAG
ncbi:MAG: sel1 repeat family protein [Deltaproteobacteria bacterium]|nr:sel1 repeat family protein [Deltaproteobacteria bacterium]